MAAKPRGGSHTDQVVRDRVFSLPRRFRRESANGLVAELELRLGDEAFAVTVVEHSCSVREGPCASPDAVLTLDPELWLAIDEGTLSGWQAFRDRDLQVKGNLDLAMRMQTLFRPHRRARRTSELEQVEVVADGITLSCYVAGKGRPVLILHGLGGSKLSLLPLMELAKRYRVIAPDLPGHGESGKPRADYSPRFYARAVRCLLNELQTDQVVIVGNSLGGRIALELALRSPGRVSALGLLSPALPGFRWRYVLGFTRVFPVELGAIPVLLRERWMRVAVSRLFADPGVPGLKAIAAASEEFIRIYRDPAARIAFLASLRQIVTERPEPFFASLRRIKQPALVVFGDQDRLVPIRLGARLVQHLPTAQLIVLKGVGHVPQFEATDQTLDALQAFLEEAPGGTPRLRR